MVVCGGGSRHVEGCWGFPCLKIKKGFLVSKFLVSWFLGLVFLVSWFQTFTKFLFNVFWKILAPYPRFSRFYQTYLHHCSVPVFFGNCQNVGFQHFEIYKTCFHC